MDDERVVLDSRRHGATLVRPLLAAVLAVVAALVVGMVVTPHNDRDLVDTAVGVVACIFVLRLLWRVWQWRVAKTVVTDRRLFQVSGVLTRKVSSMPLARMTDLTYRRPVMGRILGYGEILVESAGTEQGLARLDHLPRPDEFYRTITRLVTALAPRPVEEEPNFTNWDEEDTGPLPRVIV
jgi:uncharacterized membrane protein YdbT with pleckstrin-like domain